MSYKLPDLPYDFGALEPHIDARTMEIHHGKHHAAYTNNLNAALDQAGAIADTPLETLLADLTKVPEAQRTAVRNNGGGYFNHNLFWTVMSGQGGGEPSGELAAAIARDFGSFTAFQEQFNKAAATRFGSGWAWLCVKGDGKLCVCSTANQDNPLMAGIADCPGRPILGLDVWEHAYYLHYQNRRPDYVNAWWNVVNWSQVQANFAGK